jgi:hypothetical protein
VFSRMLEKVVVVCVNAQVTSSIIGQKGRGTLRCGEAAALHRNLSVFASNVTRHASGLI